MKKVVIGLSMIITISAIQLGAYNICNRSQIPITVLVYESQEKAIKSLNVMGWDGQFPQLNEWLRRPAGTFDCPTLFFKQHWLIEPGRCDGVFWRDLQKDLNEKYLKPNPTLYYMIFESFDKTGSTAIHFLQSGDFRIEDTINFTGAGSRTRTH